MIPTGRRWPNLGHGYGATRKLQLRRGLCPRVGELRFTLTRGLPRALRAGGAPARLRVRSASMSCELEEPDHLAVNGEIQDPASGLGEHVRDCWFDLIGPG